MTNYAEWIWRFVIMALVGGNIFWIKRWIIKREKWEKDHQEKHDECTQEYFNEGGMVTRDKFFEFCGKVRGACEIFTIAKWRDDLLQKGGVFTKDDAHFSFEKITKDILSRIEGLFTEHGKREEANIKGIRDTIDANAGKLDLVIQRQQEVVARIDHHIDAGKR